MKSVLTIAGSDPGGGAGIQADLRAFTALGVVGLSAITAITVQNSEGVLSVHPVDADVLGKQIEAVLEDATELIGVKIGMLGGQAQVQVVAGMIRRFRPPNVVLDPVLASSGGVPLLDDEGRAELLTELMPLCDLVTPNLGEAAALLGIETLADESEIIAAGEKLLKLGAPAVLIKGGHATGAPNDYLFEAGKVNPVIVTGNRIETADTHGTGCLLSAIIARGIDVWHGFSASTMLAKGILEGGLTWPITWGHGRGYPDPFTYHPMLRRTMYADLNALAGPYIITDCALRPDRSHVQIVEAALSGGAKLIQLRDKSASTAELTSIAKEIRKLCRSHDALLIVNDRIDVALASDADGVHLGPDDMRPLDAKLILGSARIIGVSVNTIAEATEAMPFATYFGVGPVFGTSTKSDAGDAIGTDRIREIRDAFPNKMIVAIGGINLSNIDSVIAAGADSAAVISAVVCAPDMRAATAELVSRFEA